MPIKVTCSNCGGVLHAPDDAAGKRGRCPTCGTVLTISEEAPRVAGTAAVPPPAASGPLDAASRPIPVGGPGRSIPPPGPGPGLVEASAPGIPAPPRPVADAPPAFPRPPAPLQSTVPAPSRMPPGPAKYSDPFTKRAAEAAEGDAATRGWAKVRRGLGWVQAGVVFLFLAAVACPLIEIAGQVGVALPAGETGFLKIDDLTAANEIRLLAVAVPAVLGFLFVVIGRLGAAGAPRSSYGRGIATAASWATLLAFLGFVAAGVVTGLVAANGSVPRVVPGQDLTKPNVLLQARAEGYIKQVFVAADEPSGQAQRIGVLALVVFGLVAELWFLNALGRYAAALQSPPAACRVSGFLILVGGLTAVGVVGLLVYDLLGQGLLGDFRAKWDNLGGNVRGSIIAGVAVAVTLLLAVLYYRMLGGLKRAVREAYDVSSVG